MILTIHERGKEVDALIDTEDDTSMMDLKAFRERGIKDRKLEGLNLKESVVGGKKQNKHK